MAKKTKWRKLLAITLAASMVLGLANMSSLVAAAAGGDDSAVQTVTAVSYTHLRCVRLAVHRTASRKEKLEVA